MCRVFRRKENFPFIITCKHRLGFLGDSSASATILHARLVRQICTLHLTLLPFSSTFSSTFTPRHKQGFLQLGSKSDPERHTTLIDIEIGCMSGFCQFFSMITSGKPLESPTAACNTSPVVHDVYSPSTDTCQYIVADATTLHCIVLDPVRC